MVIQEPIYFSSHYFFPTKYIFFHYFHFHYFIFFKTIYIFLSLFVFPLCYTKIAKKKTKTNIRQTTHFTSAAGIFNSRLREARSALRPPDYNPIVRKQIRGTQGACVGLDPTKGSSIFTIGLLMLYIVLVSGVQRIVYIKCHCASTGRPVAVPSAQLKNMSF